MNTFTVSIADWDAAADRSACEGLRLAVFVEEQHVPEHEEWDGHDEQALHVVARDRDGVAIGTGRLLPDGRIGRMAVASAWRARGVGAAILRELIRQAHERGHSEAVLSSQVHAIPFYERFGFVAEGQEYDDAGIPHRTMRLSLFDRRPADLLGGAPAPAMRRIQTQAQAVEAALEIAKLARYRLAICTSDLEPALYSTPAFRDEVRRIARSSRFAMVRILVRDPLRAIREGHHLIELASQLSSYVQIRVPDPDDEQRMDAWLIADDDAILHRPVHDRPDGVVEVGSSSLARERMRNFDRLWQRAQPDPNMRRLGV